MQIIGHRGARGTELENSLASIQQALEFDLDAIEFDIHRTKDDVLVVMHDDTTKRTAKENVRIRDVTFKELQKIQLQNGQNIPTLEEVLQVTTGRSLYIDIKDQGTTPLLFALMQQYPKVNVTVVSRLPDELQAIRALQPDISTHLYFLKVENPIIRPIHMVHVAQKVQATGLGLDKLILNPLTYRLARQRGLKVYSYPIKSLWGARLLRRLYPTIDIVTSHPEKVNHQTLRSL